MDSSSSFYGGIAFKKEKYSVDPHIKILLLRNPKTEL